MRKTFFDELFKHMKTNRNIYMIFIGLGYPRVDEFLKAFPDRVINTEAAEQTALDIAVGLAYAGKEVVVYSISTFLLFRGFETIRNYINAEKLNVKLIGAGRGQDYFHDGLSHWMFEDEYIFKKLFTNIQAAWPEYEEDIPSVVTTMLNHKKPYYINLRR